MAKSTSIDLEIFKHVATLTSSTHQAQIAQSFILELLENPQESHRALEFGISNLLQAKAETFLSLTDIPEEAYKNSKNALFMWAILTKGLIDELDDRTTVLCRKAAVEHIHRLQELELECVESSSHVETIVMAVTVILCSVILMGEGNEYLLQFFCLPWLSSGSIRTILLDLSPTLKLIFGESEDDV